MLNKFHHIISVSTWQACTIAFLAGSALEYAKIFWRPNGYNYYDTFKKRRRERALDDWEKTMLLFDHADQFSNDTKNPIESLFTGR